MSSPPRSRSSSPPLAHMAPFARRLERCCCTWVSYFPLAIVYGLTTWAAWVQASLGLSATTLLTGPGQAALGLIFWLLLNWSYTTAVFLDPGSTTTRPSHADALFPSLRNTYEPVSDVESGPASWTVKSTGESRFCKKCAAPKPDRAHHCSTCGRCVLKMDHHCPWLAACVGFRNYKPFLLFLIYTCLFCGVCVAAAGTWLWAEITDDVPLTDAVMPINYVLLAVLAGVIGLVLTGFTAWHVYLAATGQTTIESLEKTRYLAPVRRQVRQLLEQRDGLPSGEGFGRFGEQMRAIHANVVPGVTRPEEGQEEDEEQRPSAAATSLQNWSLLEARRERARYDSYLDEQDSDRLPNAWDLGWRRNLRQVFGPAPLLWALPFANSEGDGFGYEPSKKWLEAREVLAREREARARESAAWG